jgi:hypothetical protein
MRRFDGRDPAGLKRKGWVLVVVGSLLIGVGFCGTVALSQGVKHYARTTVFPMAAVVAGLGLLGMGFSSSSEARAIERERALRASKARRR